MPDIYLDRPGPLPLPRTFCKKKRDRLGSPLVVRVLRQTQLCRRRSRRPVGPGPRPVALDLDPGPRRGPPPDGGPRPRRAPLPAPLRRVRPPSWGGRGTGATAPPPRARPGALARRGRRPSERRGRVEGAGPLRAPPAPCRPDAPPVLPRPGCVRAFPSGPGAPRLVASGPGSRLRGAPPPALAGKALDRLETGTPTRGRTPRETRAGRLSKRPSRRRAGVFTYGASTNVPPVKLPL